MTTPSDWRQGRPAYRDLPRIAGLEARHAWDHFGADDRLGTLNLLDRESALRSAGLVRTGRSFPLNWSLETPDPQVPGRRAIRHSYLQYPNGIDDRYDDFFPQGSSQWDALSHIAHPEVGFYGGRPRASITTPDSNPLGIEWAARRGIVGRFVLLDIDRYRDATGAPLDQTSDTPIAVGELDAICEAQRVSIEVGDILLLRFGWITWYEGAGSTDRARFASVSGSPTPGLDQGEETAEWLWDKGVAAIAADNPGLERYPADDSDLEKFLHYRLIPFLGLAVGELFDLNALAADCADDRVFEGLFTAAPLNKTGGTGSPANALAIK